MRPGAKITAAIEILSDFENRRVPLKTAISDWGRSNRYAGAKDRAYLSGLCLDALRWKNSLGAKMSDGAPRALVLGTLRFVWRYPIETIAASAEEEPYGPGAVTPAESDALAEASSLGGDDNTQIICDYPDWLEAPIQRVFGDSTGAEMTAFSARADIDLRINTLKSTPEKTLAALKTVKGVAGPFLQTAARIPAPDPAEKAPPVTVIPAYNKGWVEVQDIGSQLAAHAAGNIEGLQIMDFCAGGGGKTLALSAMMKNTGQLYAYDRDARRLAPLYHRAKRAGIRNLQVVHPDPEKDPLAELKEKMDVVFVDAPCTGLGTWRRRPDTKWRLTERQLETRLKEQDNVLRSAAPMVKPGGKMIWVTCSFLMEENEDRLSDFLSATPGFEFVRVLDAIAGGEGLHEDALERLKECETPDGALRITPRRTSTDGFYVAVLKRAGENA